MHQCRVHWVAIGYAVVYYARAAHAFSAGIKCPYCISVVTEDHSVVFPAYADFPHHSHLASHDLAFIWLIIDNIKTNLYIILYLYEKRELNFLTLAEARYVMLMCKNQNFHKSLNSMRNCI